jgi:hypothetical protein
MGLCEIVAWLEGPGDHDVDDIRFEKSVESSLEKVVEILHID